MDHAEPLRRTLDESGMPPEPQAFKAAGGSEERAEDASINLATTGVYRFRRRHGFWYGLIAFVIGGGVTAILIAASYRNIAIEGINMAAALYQVVFGGLAGGIVLLVLAFGYAAAMRRVGRLPVDY